MCVQHLANRCCTRIESIKLWHHPFWASNYGITHPQQIERTKQNRKVFYHFAVCTIVNEILIFKNSLIRAFARLLLPKIRPTDRTARDEWCYNRYHPVYGYTECIKSTGTQKLNIFGKSVTNKSCRVQKDILSI